MSGLPRRYARRHTPTQRAVLEVFEPGETLDVPEVWKRIGYESVTYTTVRNACAALGAEGVLGDAGRRHLYKLWRRVE